MTNSDDYERGRVDELLRQHGDHLSKINGSMEHVADELHGLRLDIQKLTQAADSDRGTVITTAKALRDAEETRRARAERGWSPFQKFSVVIASIASSIAIIIELFHYVK